MPTKYSGTLDFSWTRGLRPYKSREGYIRARSREFERIAKSLKSREAARAYMRRHWAEADKRWNYKEG